MKVRFLLPLALISSPLMAEQYTTFAGIDFTQIESDFADVDTYSLHATHFFSPKETLGPLAEFEYINHASNVYASYFDADEIDGFSIGGDYINEQFLIGASYREVEDFDSTNLRLGYFFSEDFIVELNATEPDGGDTFYSYTARYNHQLEGNDYLGFSFTADEDFENFAYQGTYFVKLQGDSWVKTSLSYADGEGDDSWNLGVDYYFNEKTSLFAGIGNDDIYEVGARHYFNRNYAIEFSYSDQDGDIETIELNFIAQL